MNNQKKTVFACLLLLLTAMLWGFAMAFQQQVARHLSPFTCNALRFLIASIVLLPFVLFSNHRHHTPFVKRDIAGGAVVSLMLFLGSLCQQAGLSYTTAGKSGFITSLYVVLVPVLGLLFGQKTPKKTWLALLLALPGLYLLCVPKGESFVLNKGDLWILIGAFFWAGHILFIGRFASSVEPFKLCFLQFAFASVMNFFCAFLWEKISFQSIMAVIWPLLYCGALSNGVGFLLQSIGQKYAKPAHTALILSLESVFSMIAGMLMLQESMSGRGYAGCALMLSSVLLSQLGVLMPAERTNSPFSRFLKGKNHV